MRKLLLFAGIPAVVIAIIGTLITVHGQAGLTIIPLVTYAQYTTNSLLRPSAIYINPNSPDNLFIADSGHNQIDRFSSGALTVLAGSGVAGLQDGSLTSSEFNIPTGITGPGVVQRCGGPGCVPTVDVDLTIVDSGNNAVRHLCYIASLGSGGSPSCGPSGVTTMSGGQSGYQDGSGSQAKFTYPGSFGTSYTLQGQLISDIGNNAVRSSDTTGANIQTVVPSNVPGYQDGPLSNALFRGITNLVSAGNRTLISDTGNYVVRMLDQNNNVSTFAGNGTQGYVDGSATSAEFAMPLSLTYNSSDNYTYVADALNNCIRRIDSSGNVSTYAGQATGGLVDGPNGQAQFSHPTSIAIANGFMYVADENNNAIRRIDMANNVVSTLVH